MFHPETLDSVRFPAQKFRFGLSLGSFWKLSIINFRERKVGHQPIILANFLRKLNENENIFDKKGARDANTPLGSANASVYEICLSITETCQRFQTDSFSDHFSGSLPHA